MTKEIILGNGDICLVDDEDHLYLSKFFWGKDKNGYARRTLRFGAKRTKLFMHREILNAPNGMDVDHINGNPLDNRRSNLRLASRQQNLFNMRCTNPLGYKGVTKARDEKRYRTKIRVGRKYISRYFDTLEQAARGYDELAKQYFGDFARLNFPEIE